MFFYNLMLIITGLSFPLLILWLWYFYRSFASIRSSKKKLLGFFLVLSILIITVYARYIEPNLIVIRYTKIQAGLEARLVVFSDPHVGVYVDRAMMQRWVDAINSIERVDAVLIPGDFTSFPKNMGDDLIEKLEFLLEPLDKIEFPTYAVLGNHDVQVPGPKLDEELIAVLEDNGVVVLQNQSLETDFGLTILGLGDLWGKDSRVELLHEHQDVENLIVLTHNPETVFYYPHNIASDTAKLTIAGHTHGGQVRIPWLYKKVLKSIPSVYGFDRGLYYTPKGRVFVSSGTGMVGLPLRLGIPPTIDVLEFY